MCEIVASDGPAYYYHDMWPQRACTLQHSEGKTVLAEIKSKRWRLYFPPQVMLPEGL